MLKEFSCATLVIGAVNGRATIAAAKQLFVSIHSRFRKWGLDRAGEPTPETKVNIYESREMATFAQMCESFPHEEIDDLCLTQAQIDEFCEKNRNSFTVTTFFLFKKKINPLKRCLRWLMKLIFRQEIKRRIFVAVMRPCYETLDRVSIRAEVEHFESTTVWGGYYPYRLVVRVLAEGPIVP